MVIFYLASIRQILSVCKGLLIVLMLFFFIAFIAQWDKQFIPNTPFYSLIRLEKQWFQSLDLVLSGAVSFLRGIKIIELVNILCCIVLFKYCGYLQTYLRLRIKAQQLKNWRCKIKATPQAGIYSELDKTMAQSLQAVNKKNNRKLLFEIEKLKKKLETKSRYFAFLSMDLVDSTGMKRFENKPMIQVDFLRFKRLVEDIFYKRERVKASWTPDGVMAAFNSIDNAVMAAQDTIVRLQQFNKDVKHIEMDFVVRCGVYAGTIFYDDKLPLEEISDHIIDTAGHFQKYTEPGSIAISKELLKYIDNQEGFYDKGYIIDDIPVLQWSLPSTIPDSHMLQMTFLGTGSAFTVGEGNFHSNVWLELANETLLIDAGSDLRYSLNQQKKSFQHIRNVYITHMHGDHIGGLEWLALSTFFDPHYIGKPKLFIDSAMKTALWKHSLSGGLSTLETETATLDTWFDVQSIETGVFDWQGISFTLVPMVHVFNHTKAMPCYGLFFEYHSTRIFFTADTQYIPDKLMEYYLKADIIFHDCETTPTKSGVHAHYTDLLQLPPELRQKIWLYHYNPGSLPNAKADGFAGFVVKGQRFVF